MLRVFLCLLLIVNLLACPLRCVSCDVRDAVEGDSVTQTCSCCDEQPEVPLAELPFSQVPVDDHGRDCQCQNCICEGAVVETEVDLPGLAAVAVFWLQPSLQENQAASQRSGFRTWPIDSDRGPHLCGRDVRIAHQSWLI